MSTQRILLLSYIILGFLVALVLQHLALERLADVRGFTFLRPTYFGVEMFWADTIAYAAAIGIALFCWFDPRVKGPATQVIEELQRVTWPTFAETRTAAVAVVVATAICAVLLGAFDYTWGSVTKRIYDEATGPQQTSQNP